MSERWACHTKPRMKPAEPVTEEGKALLSESGPQEIGEPPSKWYCLSVDELPARIKKVEAQAQDLALSDVEGLARALNEWLGKGGYRADEGTARIILAAWRQERQR